MSCVALCLWMVVPTDARATIPEPPPLAAFYGFDPQSAFPPDRPTGPPRWDAGQMVLQGFLGATQYETIRRSGGGFPEVDGSGESAAQLPAIGGGAQWKLGGDSIDFGLEAMFSFGWRSNATAFAAGGGGLVIAVDIDSLVFEIYGGPVANIFLGDQARVYVSAGPLMQWTEYQQRSDTVGLDGSGSGFGTGVYARTGIEFSMGGGAMIGLGLRWSESTVDLDGGLGELELDGFQFALTITEGF